MRKTVSLQELSYLLRTNQLCKAADVAYCPMAARYMHSWGGSVYRAVRLCGYVELLKAHGFLT